MMSLMRKICCPLLLLTAIAINAHADSLPNHMKHAGELTDEAFQSAKPNVLLCVVPTEAEPYDSSDIIGKVIPGNDGNSYVCEYTQFANGVFTGPYMTSEFHWLDATYEQLASWLTSFAHIVKNDSGSAYFVFRSCEHHPENYPAVCVQSTAAKGFEFGHEVVSDNGQKSCGAFVGAVYASPYFDVVLASGNGCSGRTLSPDCHHCNGDGCSIFRCSSFTNWDKCPEGSHVCGYKTCVGHLCEEKPICEWDK
ncbi:hypothetical protein [Endozoicomonas sp.]|uniref:hypothetical protein n=1 Tax=Endozoicomonas sp. TaxID=1892382 RepID=UPI00288535B2|nr:hypothetical protein [Endozoicomonas sp.]